MNEIAFEGQPPVDGYGPGGFRVTGTWHGGGLILLPQAMTTYADPLGSEALAGVIAVADRLDVVLFGMGADIAPLPSEVKAALEGTGLGHEIMSTPSACRTYNVLLTEDRRVGAVLCAV